jgi:hypothetical protein
MVTLRTLRAASIVMALSPTTIASAALLEADDPVFGPGAITRDADTGLDWLDLRQSKLRWFDDVSSQFGDGGDFEGFRYATAAELNVLFYSSAGISGPRNNSCPGEEAVRDLMALVGETHGEFGFSASGALYDDTLDGVDPTVAGYAVLVKGNVMGFDCPSTGSSTGSRITPDEGPGIASSRNSWLVRTIPEPSTLLLGIVALGVISGWRKWKQRGILAADVHCSGRT